MEQREKLTMIVPIYNGADRIHRCLDSIYGQTYPNLEVILINDGSKDDSEKMIRSYLEEHSAYKSFTTFISRENRGVAATRNEGIRLAAGTYVAFVDQDDYLLPEYCAIYMETALKQQADIVVGGYDRITDEGKITRTVSLQEAPWSKFVVTAPWAHIYKRTFLLEHEILFLTTGIGEDIYFNLVAYAYTKNIAVIPDHSYRWVNNPDSVSNSKQNSINERSNPMFLLTELQKRLPKDGKMEKDLEEYFFLRYVVWYFTFTVRGSKGHQVEEMYHTLHTWLKGAYPNYRKNPNISLFRPKGDSLMIRICVWVFYLAESMKLLPGALKWLAQKDERK